MYTIDSKILVKKENREDTVLKEKLGGIQINVGVGEFDTYKVLSVGKKVDELKEGDVVLSYPNAGREFTFEGEKYRIISIPDILVVL